jgi:hypothetical protein
MQCYHLLMPPLIKDPPKISLPDPEKAPQWYGETWIQYPLSERIFSMSYGWHFKAKMELSLIMHSLSSRLFGDKVDSGLAAPLSQTVINYSAKLTAWYSSLSEGLSPTAIVYPFQLKLQ